MGLVIFAWLTAQSYFKEATNIDIRKVLLEENEMLGEEELIPVGIIDDGREEPVRDTNGDFWSDISNRGYRTSTF